jgi:hypothetical protein
VHTSRLADASALLISSEHTHTSPDLPIIIQDGETDSNATVKRERLLFEVRELAAKVVGRVQKEALEDLRVLRARIQSRVHAGHHLTTHISHSLAQAFAQTDNQTASLQFFTLARQSYRPWSQVVCSSAWLLASILHRHTDC